MRLQPKKRIPYDFVLELLEPADPSTRPMFGCTAVYVGERIVLILRRKEDGSTDDGIWLATTQVHHASLARDFPSMRSIALFGPGVTGWQVLPEDADDFESSAEKACEFILQGDPRIGKIPARKKIKKRTTSKKSKKPAVGKKRRR